MHNRFQNKTTLVTGAAGGIGQEVVKLFAGQGASVIASDARIAPLQALSLKLKESGHTIQAIAGDLSDPEFCNTLPDQALQLNGSLDIVINNAGLIRRGNILETSDDDWEISMAVNVESIFRICRSAIKIMKGNGGGSIVNTASCWGIYPGPNHVAYCTSKAAVAAMTKCMGRDHAADGIRVNAVCPTKSIHPCYERGLKFVDMIPILPSMN